MNSERISCRQTYEEMNHLLAEKKLIRNYSRQIIIGSEEQYTVDTALFPVEALKVYSAWNLEDSIREEDRTKYFSAHRGGSQGDYREGMKRKIANVVDCLHKFPQSKRAVITIPNNPHHCHESDDDSKCMREIHFYLDQEQDTLNASVWMRAQAAEIFPKNIHFIASLMDRVAKELNTLKNEQAKDINLGELFYLATTLVSVRED
jgi:thymidylate synthase